MLCKTLLILPSKTNEEIKVKVLRRSHEIVSGIWTQCGSEVEIIPKKDK